MWQVMRREGKGKEASHFDQIGGREGKRKTKKNKEERRKTGEKKMKKGEE